MIKGDWEVWNIEREARDQWNIQIQCANAECPSAPGEPLAYIDIAVCVDYEPEDMSVGIPGGFLASTGDLPKTCWCGNPLPKEENIEEEVLNYVEKWARDRDQDIDDHDRAYDSWKDGD